MSILGGISNSGPNRPPSVEDIFDEDFEAIFGPEPTGPPRGQRWNVSHYAEIGEWRTLRRQFKGLADVTLPEDRVAIVAEETQGVPIAWEDHSGRVYVAVVQDTVTLKRIPLRSFLGLPVPALGEAVLNNILHRGGFVDPFPERHHPSLRRRNEENKEAFGG